MALLCFLKKLLDVDTALNRPQQAPDEAEIRLRCGQRTHHIGIVQHRYLHQLVAVLKRFCDAAADWNRPFCPRETGMIGAEVIAHPPLRL